MALPKAADRYLRYIGLILLFRKSIADSSFLQEKAGQETDISVCLLSGCRFSEQLALRVMRWYYSACILQCQAFLESFLLFPNHTFNCI